MTHGILLVNLGTPNSPALTDVKRYLRHFLTDKRVINLPWYIRYLLVYGIIVPFRAKNSAHAYQIVWTDQGSPLRVHSNALKDRLQLEMASDYKVVLGMRYGNPSLIEALETLKTCNTITIIPLYPQYSSAATGSTLEYIFQHLSQWEVIPSVKIVREFYSEPAYIKAKADLIHRCHQPDHHLLFSYHGIPEQQIQRSGCKTVCAAQCPPLGNKQTSCYKAQCYETSRLLANQLDLNQKQYSTAFQSRLGKTLWIKPYTDELLIELFARGITNLTVACPSFVADCLETLEEIGIRARQQWQALGGNEFTMVPCLNDDPHWLKSIIDNTFISQCQTKS